MTKLSRENLKPFQLSAADDLAQMLANYPNPPFMPWYNPATGQPYPFLGRLKAITGSGKTPMLALAASTLGNAIVLWTTNRGAVISQTAVNLSAGGRYADLLPEGAQVVELSSLSGADWGEIVGAGSGLTIILSTVAAYNQDGDKLKIHQSRGDTSYWEMLAGRGPEGRRRELYVFYDEGHGATERQFRKLTELNPRAIVLASASPLPDELADLLPGMTSEAKSEALERQTVVVPTPKVVEAGLLKSRLYLVDCNTTRLDSLREANNKWFELSEQLKESRDWPVICCIVNSTAAGLEVWEALVQDLKVDPRRVAVHLANVDKALAEADPSVPWGQLIDTHKAKKTPEALHDEGYTHLIWNLSLREGWDEPWAYVAYLDGEGKSVTDISQKIGRFLRQPNATQFDNGDLNSAYFYFNVSDDEFISILQNTQEELDQQGYETIVISGHSARPRASRLVPVKKEVYIPEVAESFGEDLDALDNILISNVPKFAADALRAPGRVLTRVLDLQRNVEDGSLQKEEQRDDNAEIAVWEYLILRLSAADSRIAKKNSSRFSPFAKNHPNLRQKMQFGSPAMETLDRSLPVILQQLNSEFRLEFEPDQEYVVKPFNLVSPDLQIDDAKKRDRYKVRRYHNSLHQEYNGMNPFEVKVAEALDSLGLEWCRNPSQTGYGIPIPEIGEGTTDFYPDFLLWSPKEIWAIDPKGRHLINDAIYHKMMGVSDVDGLPIKIRVALILEGEFRLGVNQRPQPVGKKGYTLILKRNGSIREKHSDNLKSLIRTLK